jgi:hypothetical protein
MGEVATYDNRDTIPFFLESGNEFVPVGQIDYLVSPYFLQVSQVNVRGKKQQWPKNSSQNGPAGFRIRIQWLITI